MSAFFYIFSGIVSVIVSFFGFFILSKLDDDKTVGGAYFALFVMSSPVAFILGIIVYHFLKLSL